MRKRYWLAALIAPAIAPALYFVVTVAFSGYLDVGEGRLIKLALVTIGAILPVSYLACFALGGPILLGLSKLQRMSMRNVLALSVIAAFSLGFIWGQVVRSADGSSGLPMWQTFNVSLISGLAGLVVSLMFCLMAGISWRGE